MNYFDFQEFVARNAVNIVFTGVFVVKTMIVGNRVSLYIRLQGLLLLLAVLLTTQLLQTRLLGPDPSIAAYAAVMIISRLIAIKIIFMVLDQDD